MKTDGGSTDRPKEVSLIKDDHWRSTLASALRVMGWQSATAPAPATILGEALAFVQHMPLEEFQRLAVNFDTGRSGRSGAVRIRDDHHQVAVQIAGRLTRENLMRTVGVRNVVIVALYAFARDVLAKSQLTLFRRVAAYLKLAFRNPEAKRRAIEAADLTPRQAETLLKAANAGTPLMANRAGREFLHLAQMVEGLGGASHVVVHAATVAASDDDFFRMVAAD